MFPGCEVFVTGSAVQPGKPLKAVKDLDLVVITPVDWDAKKRADFENQFNKKDVKVPVSQVFAAATGKNELAADVKIMSPREGFGMIGQTSEFDPKGAGEGKNRTGHDPNDPSKQRLRSLDYLRLDVEPTQEKPADKPGVTRDPKADVDHDGIQDAARVGVPGKDVPSVIPRLDNLTPAERDAEAKFAAQYEKDGGKELAEKYLAMVANHPKDKMTFATDDAKALSEDYNPAGMQEKVDALRAQILDPTDPKKQKLLTPDKMTPAQLRVWEEFVPLQEQLFTHRGENNAAVHQTANAVAKKAFLMRLDQIRDDPTAKKQILVTAGGVGAGKSFSIDNNDDAKALKAESSVIWDSAGEQNSTELPWVLDEAKKRGLTIAIIYVHKRPEQSWENMKFGVTPRARDQSGRMVDARLHADSYAEGARNFDAFQKQWAGKDGVKFVVLDATDENNPAKKVDKLPDDALTLDADKVHMRNIAFLEAQKSMPDRITGPGGDLGQRVWGDAGNVEQLNEQWKKDGLPLDQRARRAHDIHSEMRTMRRDALKDTEAIKAMRQRNQQLYGNTDGPTFDQLVAAYEGWGLTKDQAYEAIILGPM
jgi:hypothetical protein